MSYQSTSDIEWSDIDRLISDLKNDGYEPMAMEGIPSDATKKQVYLSVDRSVEQGIRRFDGRNFDFANGSLLWYANTSSFNPIAEYLLYRS